MQLSIQILYLTGPELFKACDSRHSWDVVRHRTRARLWLEPDLGELESVLGDFTLLLLLCYSSPPGLGISKAKSGRAGGLLSLGDIDRVFGNLSKEVIEPIEAGSISF